MPPTGSIFTDWQQVDNERRLLMDEDFSWSDPPARPRRRRAEAPARIRRRSAVAEAEPVERDPSGEAGETHSEFDEVMQRWNEAYGDASRGYRASRGCHDARATARSKWPTRATLIVTRRNPSQRTRPRRGGSVRFRRRREVRP